VVRFRYELSTDPSIAGTVSMSLDRSGGMVGALGPFALDDVPRDGGLFAVRVSVTDPDGAVTTADPVTVVLNGCGPEG